MILTDQHKREHDWPKLVREHRLSLGLSMADYGRKYGVVRQTVFYWEKGTNEVPNQVSWDILRWVELKGGEDGQE